MAPLRLAVLETDTPVPGAVERYGNYTGVFASLISTALGVEKESKALDEEVVISGHHVVDDYVPRTPYPSLNNVDAVLITGSKHNAHDDDPWILELVEFVQKCLSDVGKGVKVVGICFGHQIVARALGLKTGPNAKGWEVSVTDVELSTKGKEIFGLDKLKIHQMHRDIIFDKVSEDKDGDNQNNEKNVADQTNEVKPLPPPAPLPMGIELLASNSICRNQGMYLPRKLFTVQGHPEFTSDIVSEILDLRHKTGIIGDDVYTSGIKRVGNEHDGVLIARAFLKICKE